ncbi:MAG: hypothetical protein K2P58_07975 [Hyphomonadaceae bacterium]|nr:hypothetical protein [Hyphomonadaceae bacterium]
MAQADRKHRSDGEHHWWPPLRLFERRQQPEALPPLLTAMRQLRHQVLDAQQDGAAPFVARAQAIAALARDNGELETSAILLKLAAVAEVGVYLDVRADLLDLLDVAHAALNAPDNCTG